MEDILMNVFIWVSPCISKSKLLFLSQVIYVRNILEKADEDKTLSPQEQFEKFTKVLMEYDAAYAAYDAEYFTPQGVKRDKVLFVFWWVFPSPMYSSERSLTVQLPYLRELIILSCLILSKLL